MEIETKTEKTNESKQNESVFEKIHKMAAQPSKLMIDEVALAWILSLRVNDWENLGNEFGGYKVGSIYSYISDVLMKNIGETLDVRYMVGNAVKEKTVDDLFSRIPRGAIYEQNSTNTKK